jgi:4,5-DOPA dioxygenase extradiol
VVHNLGSMDRRSPDEGFAWARRFNEKAIAIATSRPADAASLVRDPGFLQVAPTPEHFLPFLYVAGAAAAAGAPMDVLVDGYAYGSLSMTSFVVGMSVPSTGGSTEGSPPLGSDAPADQTNL